MSDVDQTSEIVVTAYSGRYVVAARHVLQIEGGFVNDPADRGGATKFGISLRFLMAEGAIDLDEDGYADFDLDMDGDIDGVDIRGLTKGDAIYLFHRCFWQRLECESFPFPIGEMMFDQGVNGGLFAARKLLQQAINRVLKTFSPSVPPIAVDGVIGPMTRIALDVLCDTDAGIERLADEYRAAARARYRAIVDANPSQRRFLVGWLNRADRMGRY